MRDLSPWACPPAHFTWEKIELMFFQMGFSMQGRLICDWFAKSTVFGWKISTTEFGKKKNYIPHVLKVSKVMGVLEGAVSFVRVPPDSSSSSPCHLLLLFLWWLAGQSRPAVCGGSVTLLSSALCIRWPGSSCAFEPLCPSTHLIGTGEGGLGL